jgi:hypothetical protein
MLWTDDAECGSGLLFDNDAHLLLLLLVLAWLLRAAVEQTGPGDEQHPERSHR